MNHLWKTIPQLINRFELTKGHATEESWWPSAHGAEKSGVVVNCWISQQPPQSDTPAAIHDTTSTQEPCEGIAELQGRAAYSRYYVSSEAPSSGVDDADQVLIPMRTTSSSNHTAGGVHSVAAPTDISGYVRFAITDISQIHSDKEIIARWRTLHALFNLFSYGN